MRRGSPEKQLAKMRSRDDTTASQLEMLARAKAKKDQGQIGSDGKKLAVSSAGSMAAASGLNAEQLAGMSKMERRQKKLDRVQGHHVMSSKGAAGGVRPQKQGNADGDDPHDQHVDKEPLEPCPHVEIGWRRLPAERPAGAQGERDDEPWKSTIDNKDVAAWVKGIPPHLGGGNPMTLSTVFSSQYKRMQVNLRKQETLWWNRQKWDDSKALLVSELVGSGCLRTCRTLSIYGNHFTDKGTDALFEALKRGLDGSGLDSPKLRTLNMAGNAMTAEGAPAFARYAMSSAGKHLLMLNLNGNRLGDDGTRVLCDAIERGGLAHVTNLGIKGNRIGDVGARHLSIMAINGGLKQLLMFSLNDNLIGDEGLSYLSSSFGKGGFPKLASLNISGNEFGTTGAAALFQVACLASFTRCPRIERTRSPNQLIAPT